MSVSRQTHSEPVKIKAGATKDEVLEEVGRKLRKTMRDYKSKHPKKKEPDYGLQELPDKVIDNSPRIERLRKMLMIKERMKAYEMRGSRSLKSFKKPKAKK